MKTTLISVAIVLVAVTGVSGAVYYHKKHTPVIASCPTDVMMCPDGSSVPRSGSACEFGVCKQTPPIVIEEDTTPIEPPASSAVTVIPLTNKEIPANLFTKIRRSAVSIFKQTTTKVESNISSGIKETSQTVSTEHITAAPPLVKPVALPHSTLSEVRYGIEKNKIVDENNIVIYTLPSTPYGSSGMGTHDVNAVPIGEIAPIIGAVPVSGLPGKYYLSENSFGSAENCRFSNKIYILDTKTGERILMYEENDTMLADDDPRACNSEMYLLATDNEKLVMKYHTVGTNTTCDSTWSEPEKTWYLDVTKPALGTKRYFINSTLYTKAEASEAECRLKYNSVPVESTSTSNG